MRHIERNVASVGQRIATACARAGRDPSEVTLLAVTKTKPAAAVDAAVAAGVTDVGESRVQEAEAKIAAVESTPRWHLIGKLQSNKARRAAALFDVIHAVDRPDLASRLARAAAEQQRRLDVYVQLDWVRAEIPAPETEARARDVCLEVAGSDALRLVGLMTLPPFEPDPETARPWFQRLRAFRDELTAAGLEVPGLSMGMTNDFEVAIEEGATIVRVGTAIFGSRT